ncbi:MAG TPA: CCC motif membrane protein [Bacteroidia bacterium]
MANDIPNEQQINLQFQQQFSPGGPNGKKIPNSVGVLVLGICSIFPGCICYGVPGLICAIIALTLAKKANLLYRENPSAYSQSSYSNLKAGRICAIVGLCTSSIFILIMIIYVVILGAVLTAVPWSNM